MKHSFIIQTKKIQLKVERIGSNCERLIVTPKGLVNVEPVKLIYIERAYEFNNCKHPDWFDLEDFNRTLKNDYPDEWFKEWSIN